MSDLQETYGYSYEVAVNMIYNSGLEIHCAMDPQIQSDLENLFINGDCMPEDEDIEAGMFIMDPYTGRVIAVIGSRHERGGVRLSSLSVPILWDWRRGLSLTVPC